MAPDNDMNILLTALTENNAEIIKQHTIGVNINQPLRFKIDPKNISKEMLGNYLKWKDKNLLQIVCHENRLNALECVKLLLTNDQVDPLYEVESTEKTAVHYAAEGGNIKILTELLGHLDRNGLSYEKLNNIFYTLIKYINFNKKENEKKYIPIFTLLLKKNLDINIPDRLSGETPIYAAAFYKLKDIITLILNKKNGNIDFRSFKDINNKSALDLITHNLYDGNIDSTFTYTNDNTQMLYKYIREDQNQIFYVNFSRRKSTLTEDIRLKILHLAVHKKRKHVVEFLLRPNNANVSESYLGAHVRLKDHPMVLACQMGYHEIVALFVDNNPYYELVNTSLQEVTKAPYADYTSKEIDYDKVVKELARCKNFKINCLYSKSITLLSYAVRYQKLYMAFILLNNGASMVYKDANGKLPIEEMNSKLLEEHLNNCISYADNNCVLEKEIILIKFTSLLPPRKGTTRSEESEQIQDTNEYPLESEVLQYIGNSSELKHLLTHPVILALIYMKWHRIRGLIFADLAIHLLFVTLLVIMILCNVCNVLLAVPLVLIIILELFQIGIFRRRYFHKFENWLKMFLSGITFAMIFFECNHTIHRQLSAIAIIMCAIELVLLLGCIPCMSTNITILRTICWTFLSLLFWYAILLSGFAYGFHILFGGTKYNNNGDRPNFFANMKFSFLKTVTMAVGELDTTSLDFNTYPPSSYLVFLIFVFFIAIVLFNLMISLAISDTEKIKKDAKIYEQKLLVDYIAKVEIFLEISYKYLPSKALFKRVCLFPLNNNSTEYKFDPNTNPVKNKYCFFNCTEMHLSKNVQHAIIKKLKEIPITKQVGNLEQ